MLTFLTWHPTAVVYVHCGSKMTWETLRAAYVCHCGATR